MCFRTSDIKILLRHGSLTSLPSTVSDVTLKPIPLRHRHSHFLTMKDRSLAIQVLSYSPSRYLRPLDLRTLTSQTMSLLVASTDRRSKSRATIKLTLSINLRGKILTHLGLSRGAKTLASTHARCLKALPMGLSIVASRMAKRTVLTVSSHP